MSISMTYEDYSNALCEASSRDELFLIWAQLDLDKVERDNKNLSKSWQAAKLKPDPMCPLLLKDKQLKAAKIELEKMARWHKIFQKCIREALKISNPTVLAAGKVVQLLQLSKYGIELNSAADREINEGKESETPKTDQVRKSRFQIRDSETSYPALYLEAPHIAQSTRAKLVAIRVEENAKK